MIDPLRQDDSQRSQSDAEQARGLTPQRVLVTGGARGIGRGIVEAFSATGAQVFTCGRGGRQGLEEEVHWLQLDLAEPGSADSLVTAAVGALGGIDVVVNNAGVQVEKTVADSSDADYHLVMGVNARAVFEMCRRVIPELRSSGGGAIINIGSISATHADPSMALYNASKAFVHGLTRSIAVDHGADGIRCNAICPGWIDTGMADAAFSLARNPTVARIDALARHAAGRLGTPADIAATALWLASDGAAFVTGQTITVDGGLVAASPLRPQLS